MATLITIILVIIIFRITSKDDKYKEERKEKEKDAYKRMQLYKTGKIYDDPDDPKSFSYYRFHRGNYEVGHKWNEPSAENDSDSTNKNSSNYSLVSNSERASEADE